MGVRSIGRSPTRTRIFVRSTSTSAARRTSAPAPAAARSPEDGADSRDQFLRTERLHEVVVAAELESHDAVGLLAARGQHHDRDRGGPSQLARHVEPVHARQSQIQHHQIRAPSPSARERGLAVADGRHLEAGDLEVVAQRSRDLHLVLDDQDALHGCEPLARAGRRQPCPRPATCLLSLRVAPRRPAGPRAPSCATRGPSPRTGAGPRRSTGRGRIRPDRRGPSGPRRGRPRRSGRTAR